MTDLSGMIERYLNLSSDQMKLTAANIANADTPGYKTQGFDFEQEMARAANGLGATTTPAGGPVDGLVARPDGNDVSMDREGLLMAKSQLQFRLGVELMKHQVSSIMSAIHADSK